MIEEQYMVEVLSRIMRNEERSFELNQTYTMGTLCRVFGQCLDAVNYKNSRQEN